MKIKKRYLISVLAACVLIGLVYAQLTWQTVSNVYHSQTDVSASQPLTISPDPCIGGGSSPGLRAMSTGVPADLWLDVNNPNNASVNGWVMINFTSTTTINPNDVSILSASPFYVAAVSLGVYNNNTLAYKIALSTTFGLGDFRFDPGYRANFTCFTIQYNTPGSYNWTLAICQ